MMAYTHNSSTSRKIAKIINHQAGYERVLDVRRVKLGSKRGWEVDANVDNQIWTYHYQSLRMVELGIAQLTMFPDIDRSV